MIVGVLLAAGQGRRFGGAKQCAKLPDGQTLLQASARNMRAALEHVVIVVSDESAVFQHASQVAVELDCDVVVNRRALEGMATSIACGVKASPDAEGWIIGLGDMPLVKASTIAAVATALQKQRGIVVAMCRHQRGHPVGFDQQFSDALQLLAGETGGRELIARNHAEVTFLDLDDLGILADIDVLADVPRNLA